MIEYSVDENLKNYNSLQKIHDELSSNVEKKLYSILKEYSIKFQSISKRVKTEESLRNKLIKSGKELKDINDFAGCRVVFYLERDMECAYECIINDSIFHNMSNNKCKFEEDGYEAIHFVVELEDNKFTNYKCEIQFTTVLYHAWSELAHDIIYKKENSILSKYNDSLKYCEKIFIDVKRNIKDAQYSLDFIFDGINRINSIEKNFNIENIKNIIKLEDSNEIYRYLKILYAYIDGCNINIDIYLYIRDIIEKSINMDRDKWADISEKTHGYSNVDVIKVCLDILDALIFHSPKSVLDILIWTLNSECKEVKNIALSIAVKITKYNRYGIEYYIFDAIEKNKNTDYYLNFIIGISKNMFSYYRENGHVDDDLCFLNYSELDANNVKVVRSKMIDVLISAYHDSKNIYDQERILKSFDYVCNFSSRGRSRDIEDVIFGDIKTIIEFYRRIFPKSDHKILLIIEKQLVFFKKNGYSLDNIDELKFSIINYSEKYKLYRLFCNGIYTAEDIYRYIKEIEHIKFIKCILSISEDIKNIDKIDYYFFNMLAEYAPKIASELISYNEKNIECFLPHLIKGIWRSGQREEAKNILRKWINDGLYIEICVYLLKECEDICIDISVIQKILNDLITQNNINAIKDIAFCVLRKYETHKNDIYKDLFLKALSFLGRNAAGFEKDLFNSTYSYAIFDDFHKNEWKMFLKCIIDVYEITFYLQKIMSKSIKNYPEEFINFFYERINLKKERYIAFPYKFEHIDSNVIDNNIEIIRHAFMLIEKYKNNNDKYIRFICALFYRQNKELEKYLIERINLRDESIKEITPKILLNYEDENFIIKICKEFIKSFEIKKEDSQFSDLIICFYKYEVQGNEIEIEIIEKYNKILQKMNKWENDENTYIKDFFIECKKTLSNLISINKKEADKNRWIKEKNYKKWRIRPRHLTP